MRPVFPASLRRGFALTPLVLLALILKPPPQEASATPDAGAQVWLLSARQLAAWQGNGVVAGETARLHPGPVFCRADDDDGGRVTPDGGLCRGLDPHPAIRYYNGGRFWFGTLRSPWRLVRFDHAIVSWDAQTPPGTWLEAHLRFREGGSVSRWYSMPIWAAGTETIRRHSVAGQRDHLAVVETDTLHVFGQGAALQVALTLFTARRSATPAVSLLAVTTSLGMAYEVAAPTAPARDLAVPGLSQMLPAYPRTAFGGGGEAWCSPTSTAMVLNYWSLVLRRSSLRRSVLQAAAGTYDYTYAGTGNWPFNTAWAAESGLTAYVARLPSLASAWPWIADGVPLVLSIGFGRGALPGSPLPWSAGHLLVLRGFTASGDPIVNDPAAPDNAAVRIIYPRAALERAWLTSSDGTVYLIYPHAWHVPRFP